MRILRSLIGLAVFGWSLAAMGILHPYLAELSVLEQILVGGTCGIAGSAGLTLTAAAWFDPVDNRTRGKRHENGTELT